MRRLIFILAGLTAVLAFSVSAASGASKCGNLYQPSCTKPHIAPISINAQCRKIGTVLHLPAIPITSNAGLKKITVTLVGRSKPLATFSNLKGTNKKTIRGVRVSTHGLSPGKHTIVIRATDVRNRSSTERLSLAICKIKPPPFTG